MKGQVSPTAAARLHVQDGAQADGPGGGDPFARFHAPPARRLGLRPRLAGDHQYRRAAPRHPAGRDGRDRHLLEPAPTCGRENTIENDPHCQPAVLFIKNASQSLSSHTLGTTMTVRFSSNDRVGNLWRGYSRSSAARASRLAIAAGLSSEAASRPQTSRLAAGEGGDGDEGGHGSTVSSVTVKGKTNTYKGVVALSKLQGALKDQPQSITVLNKPLLEARGVVSLSDALRNVPGIGHRRRRGRPDRQQHQSATASPPVPTSILDGFRDRGQYYRDTFALDAGRGSHGSLVDVVRARLDRRGDQPGLSKKPIPDSCSPRSASQAPPTAWCAAPPTSTPRSTTSRPSASP